MRDEKEVDAPLELEPAKPGPKREELETMMEKFLKRRKIKKIKRGKSGFNQARMESNWGYTGGYT